jgi:hypothetical protein
MENVIERPRKESKIVITNFGDLTNEEYFSICFCDDIIDSKYRVGGVPRKCFANKKYYDSNILNSDLCFKPLIATEEFYKGKNGQLTPRIVTLSDEKGDTIWSIYK